MLWFALWSVFYGAVATTAAAGAPPCAEGRAALLACIDANSPELRAARLEVESLKAREGAAAQWLNPAFGINSIGGTAAGVRNSETDLSLAVPVELGGKIAARRDLARGQTAGAEASLFAARVRLRVAALVALNRYRQALHEKEATEEAGRSFARLIKQYAGRPRLSPEQETSLAVYKMAKNEYQLRTTSLDNEIAALRAFFRINAGVGDEAVAGLLPPEPKDWPQLKGPGDLTRGPRIAALGAGVQSAEAERTAARGQSWPTLTVGPSARLQTQAGVRSALWGFNLGFAVPIFNANGPGRAAAETALRFGETARELGLLVEQNERQRAAEVYQQSVELVRASTSHADLEAAHHAIDRNFSRGLVPSALIIEAHRTYVDLERSRNERELTALRALYDVHTIDGTILELTQ